MSFLEFLVFGVCSVYSQIGECRPAVVNGLLDSVLHDSMLKIASDTELGAYTVARRLIDGLDDKVIYKMINIVHM